MVYAADGSISGRARDHLRNPYLVMFRRRVSNRVLGEAVPATATEEISSILVCHRQVRSNKVYITMRDTAQKPGYILLAKYQHPMRRNLRFAAAHKSRVQAACADGVLLADPCDESLQSQSVPAMW